MRIHRCPYCKQLLGSEPVATCPHCKKAMNLPKERERGPLMHVSRRRSDDEPRPRERTPHLMPTIGLDVKNMAVGGMLLAMLIVGGLLVMKTGPATGSGNLFRQKRYETAKRELNVLRTALDMFNADCGRYPTTEEGLMALLRNPGDKKWGGHYIKLLKSDPWRNRYVYRYTNDTIALFSRGQDGTAGTSDDIFPSVDQAEIDKLVRIRKYGPPTNSVDTGAAVSGTNRVGSTIENTTQTVAAVVGTTAVER